MKGAWPVMKVRNAKSARRGAATVEFAIVAIVMATLVMGVIEITRIIQVKSYLADAVRSGCRSATQPASSNAQVTSAVNAILSLHSVSGTPTVTVLVNGVAADAATALRDDKVTVTVSIAVGVNSVISPSYFTKTSDLTETLVMMHQ